MQEILALLIPTPDYNNGVSKKDPNSESGLTFSEEGYTLDMRR